MSFFQSAWSAVATLSSTNKPLFPILSNKESVEFSGPPTTPQDKPVKLEDGYQPAPTITATEYPFDSRDCYSHRSNMLLPLHSAIVDAAVGTVSLPQMDTSEAIVQQILSVPQTFQSTVSWNVVKYIAEETQTEGTLWCHVRYPLHCRGGERACKTEADELYS